jgi:hypothetical protein
MVPAGIREETLYRAVVDGLLEVRPDGSVWRVAEEHIRGGKVWRYARTPHRVDGVANGYRIVKVMRNRRQTSCPAHRLVWRTLRGPIPPGLTINHIDGDKANNDPANLELATYSEQVKHMLHVLKKGRVLDQNGEKNLAATLTEKAVREIRRRRAAGERLKTIAADFGVTDRQVSKIALGQRWGWFKS